MINLSKTMPTLKGANELEPRWTLAPRNWIRYAAAVIVRLKVLAPYALLELILPGGSVMALLLWLYRRRKNGIGFVALPPKFLAGLRSLRFGCAAPT